MSSKMLDTSKDGIEYQKNNNKDTTLTPIIKVNFLSNLNIDLIFRYANSSLTTQRNFRYKSVPRVKQ